jgi:glyoxylase-like metal-dependent hydrolase (beta-lactamase superfamily II)
MTIAPGLHSLSQEQGGHVHAFLVEDDDGLTLIDTLYDDDAHVILEALIELGKTPRDIKRIIISHAHKSHLGGLAAIQRMSGAAVYAQGREVAIIQGKAKAARVPLPKISQRPRNFTVWKLQTALHFGIGSHAPCDVHALLKDGDRLGSLQVIGTPGHTPGSLSFWWPERKALFAADSVCTWPEIGPWEGFTLDEKAYWNSIGKLADLSTAEILCSGHGDPLMTGAADTIRGLKR